MLADLGSKANSILQEVNPRASIASWAMRWVKSLQRVQVILSGMSYTVQLEDNINSISLENDVSFEEKELITKAAFIVRSNTAVACTKCRYCTPHCPMPVIVRKVSIFRHTWQSFQKCFYKSKI